MKSRFLIVTLIVIAIMTGCANGEEKERKLILSDISQALKAQGAELFSLGQSDDVFNVLNRVKPDVFTIGKPTEDVARLENIYVYIFDSEQARKDGLVTFNQHLETVKLTTFPFAYEQKNALVIYYSFKKENAKFDAIIQTALQKL